MDDVGYSQLWWSKASLLISLLPGRNWLVGVVLQMSGEQQASSNKIYSQLKLLLTWKMSTVHCIYPHIAVKCFGFEKSLTPLTNAQIAVGITNTKDNANNNSNKAWNGKYTAYRHKNKAALIESFFCDTRKSGRQITPICRCNECQCFATMPPEINY